MSTFELIHLFLLLLVPLAPLLLLVGLCFNRLSRTFLRLAPWAALPGLILALLPLSAPHYAVPWLLIGGHLGLDETGRPFLFLFAVLWLAAGLYTHGYLAKDTGKRRFWIFFLLTMSGNLGLPLVQGVLAYYVCFALMSFSAYGLVVHDGSALARKAGRVYLYLVMTGEIFLFVGFVLAVHAAEATMLSEVAGALAAAPYKNLIIGLLLAGFGIKAGIVPLHVWLPLAHPAAPVPASAVLSGAMIKAGLLGLMRLLPLGEAVLPGWSHLLLLLGLIMAFFGILVGILQVRAKTVLAYSSISQMGFPLIGLGIGLAQPTSWPLLAPAVAFYAVHHGLAKGALFLGIGMVAKAEAGRLVGRWPLLIGLMLPALALSGAPLTSGAPAKEGLKPFIGEAAPFWSASLPLLLALAAVGTTVIMARFLFVLRFDGSQHRPTTAMWAGWLLTLAGVVLGAAAIIPGYADHIHTAAPTWNQLWPVLVGATLAAVCWLSRAARSLADKPLIPAGDLIPALEYLTNSAGRSWRRQRRTFRNHRPDRQFCLSCRLAAGSKQLPWRKTEQTMRQLPIAGLLFVAILILLLFL